MDKKEQLFLMNDSSAFMRFKLKTLLKRQIKGQRKFQKHLADLKLLIDKYVSGTDSREKLLNVLNGCLRVSDFHVAALRDLLSDLHGPQFTRIRQSPKGGAVNVRFGSMRPTELGNSVTKESRLNPRKVRLNE